MIQIEKLDVILFENNLNDSLELSLTKIKYE
jgi:hypothetical protein